MILEMAHDDYLTLLAEAETAEDRTRRRLAIESYVTRGG